MKEIILESVDKTEDFNGVHQLFTFNLVFIESDLNFKDNIKLPYKYMVVMYEKAYKNGIEYADFVTKYYFDKIEEAIKRFRKDIKEIC